MAQSSPIEILEDQIRECYGRVVWTHKTHEKCADIVNARNNRIKFWQIVFSAITTSGILVAVLGEVKLAGILAAVVSTMSLAISTYVKKYDLGKIAQEHTAAAIAVWDVREKYLSLLTDLKAGLVNEEEIRETRDVLQSELHKLYKGFPRTIDKAYDQATKALKRSEEMTFSDEEIDLLVPRSLRKSSD